MLATEPPAAGETAEAEGGEAEFAATNTAPREARKWVVAHLIADGADDGLADAGELLTSEVVTNALLQKPLRTAAGHAVIRVRIVPGAGVYRIEVYDGEPTAPPTSPGLPDQTCTSGRGLPLVDAYAAQRGWRPYVDPVTGQPGKCVWFTLAADAKPDDGAGRRSRADGRMAGTRTFADPQHSTSEIGPLMLSPGHGDDELLRPCEVAQIFGVRTPTIARWAREGKLPAMETPGGHRRYRRSAVLALSQSTDSPDSSK